jgi:hypothetical protein
VGAPFGLTVEGAQALDDFVGFEGFDSGHAGILSQSGGRARGYTSPSLSRAPLHIVERDCGRRRDDGR